MVNRYAEFVVRINTTYGRACHIGEVGTNPRRPTFWRLWLAAPVDPSETL